MRILLASDIHGSERGVTSVLQTIERESPDLLVACGDLTDFGPVSFARDFLRKVSVKTFAVPGNCDPPELVDELENIGVNLHGKKVSHGGRVFVGLGGSNPTPFHTIFEITEEEILRILEEKMEHGAMLISHPPPFGLCDLVRTGDHAGSRAVRAVVDRFQPKVVMSGHIHEARGVSKGVTTVVNPGMAARGNLAVIDIDGEVEVRLL